MEVIIEIKRQEDAKSSPYFQSIRLTPKKDNLTVASLLREINANPDIENKINNYVKENNINLNQVMLDLILEKIEDEEDYKLAVEAYEEEKDNRENWISHEDLIKKLGLENEI
mgnify:CR=1 FL=1